MTAALLVLVSICGTPSAWGADSLDPCGENLSAPQTIIRAKLYRALRYSSGMPVPVDSLPAMVGVEVCFPFDSTIAATYWMTSVNVLGKESPCKGRGLSFPRVVGVGNPEDPVPGENQERYYDLSGRRLPHKPTAKGLYWLGPAYGPRRMVYIR